VPAYHRVPTVGTAPQFIAGLAGLVRAARIGTASGEGARLCSAGQAACALSGAAH
jgi:hypothetical protein